MFRSGSSPPRLLTGAACGGSGPPPAQRSRRANLPHLSSDAQLVITLCHIALAPALVAHPKLVCSSPAQPSAERSREGAGECCGEHGDRAATLAPSVWAVPPPTVAGTSVSPAAAPRMRRAVDVQCRDDDEGEQRRCELQNRVHVVGDVCLAPRTVREDGTTSFSGPIPGNADQGSRSVVGRSPIARKVTCSTKHQPLLGTVRARLRYGSSRTKRSSWM